MSRCFPFPPPGYERKLDYTDFLKKETRKEKKHKKDKKDRDKRDGKEKREEKRHKEKNDKKDKHKEKNQVEEKRFDEHSESQNRGSLFQKSEHEKQKDGSSGHKKSSVQPRNGGHKELITGKEEYVQSWGQNEKMQVNRIKTEDIDNSKIVQELSRRTREEGKRTGSLQFPVDSRKLNVDHEIPKTDVQGINSRSTFDRMSMVQNTTDGKKTRESVKEITKLSKAEGNKNKYMKNGETIGSFNNLSTSNTPKVGFQHSGSELKKRKDMERNGFSHGCLVTENEPRPNKTARPASGILTENARKQDFFQNTGLNQSGTSTKVDTKERKVNGKITSQPVSPVPKKPPTATANHILVKPTSTRSPPVNAGHIPSQPLPVPAPRPPSSVPNHITNTPLPVSSTKPSQPLLNSKKKIRPPHPDTKYLKQILAVPEVDQWSGLDNQEWLFSSKDYPHFTEKAGKCFLQDNKEVEEVWSEAKQLESVDVFALPYVIPY